MMLFPQPVRGRLIDAANPDGVIVAVIGISEDAGVVMFVDEDGYPHLEDAEQVSLDGLTPPKAQIRE